VFLDGSRSASRLPPLQAEALAEVMQVRAFDPERACSCRPITCVPLDPYYCDSPEADAISALRRRKS
jgi:hypothetical protein